MLDAASLRWAFDILALDARAGHPVSAEDYERMTGPRNISRGCLYVVTRSDMKGVKIGASINPASRKHSANVFDPEKAFTLVGSVICENYREMEREAHAMAVITQLAKEST